METLKQRSPTLLWMWVFNPAVDVGLLCEILSWKTQGALFDDIVEWLRIRTVPSGYVPHNRIAG